MPDPAPPWVVEPVAALRLALLAARAQGAQHAAAALLRQRAADLQEHAALRAALGLRPGLEPVTEPGGPHPVGTVLDMATQAPAAGPPTAE